MGVLFIFLVILSLLIFFIEKTLPFIKGEFLKILFILFSLYMGTYVVRGILGGRSSTIDAIFMYPATEIKIEFNEPVYYYQSKNNAYKIATFLSIKRKVYEHRISEGMNNPHRTGIRQSYHTYMEHYWKKEDKTLFIYLSKPSKLSMGLKKLKRMGLKGRIIKVSISQKLYSPLYSFWEEVVY